ncbi:MAG TPA: FAD-dependent oxidoreductase, partial [Anaerolineae bacterium]|nr:FAD-dependent oxidoreductase [Anaerolineae bacterium]
SGRGVVIYTGANVKRAFLSDGVREISFENPEGEIIVGAKKIFVAAGRRPLMDNLNLEDIGVESSKEGIRVNEYLQTTVGNIFAAGDVIPGPQLAQAAAYEGDLAAMNALGDKKAEVSYRVIPRAIWSYPIIASVGITEDEAKERGIKYTVEESAFAGLGRALTSGERLGFVKVIANPDTEEIIGLHAIGHHADEIIHEGVIAMQSRIKVSDLAQAIHCELTMSEGLGNALIDLNESIKRRKHMAA